MSEATEQKEIVAWFITEYPEYARCLRISLAGLNFGSGQRAARMVNHVRSQGIQAGESDIAILIKRGDFGSLLIEHKKDDAMRGATGQQLEYIQYHNSIGNCAVVTKGLGMAKAAIKTYMSL
ncbi:MAG: hypothetical protein ACI9DH_000580 [Halioglobus sp.]|jgi:hypothetical protein